MAGAVLLGSLCALSFDLPELAIHLMIALLSGGIILNVIKEKLPTERHNRFLAFFLGSLFYGGMLVIF